MLYSATVICYGAVLLVMYFISLFTIPGGEQRIEYTQTHDSKSN